MNNNYSYPYPMLSSNFSDYINNTFEVSFIKTENNKVHFQTTILSSSMINLLKQGMVVLKFEIYQSSTSIKRDIVIQENNFMNPIIEIDLSVYEQRKSLEITPVLVAMENIELDDEYKNELNELWKMQTEIIFEKYYRIGIADTITIEIFEKPSMSNYFIITVNPSLDDSTINIVTNPSECHIHVSENTKVALTSIDSSSNLKFLPLLNYAFTELFMRLVKNELVSPHKEIFADIIDITDDELESVINDGDINITLIQEYVYRALSTEYLSSLKKIHSLNTNILEQEES